MIMRSVRCLVIARLFAAAMLVASFMPGFAQTATNIKHAVAGTEALVENSERIAAPPLSPNAKNRTVILVRHAEKADVQTNDPGLTPAGKTRANALAEALKDAGITAILTTALQRTIQTAQPIAALRGITPQVVALQRTGQGSHIDAVVAAIRAPDMAKKTVVLVVGHSNTVPAIVSALGGPLLPKLCESDYASLFVLTLDAAGGARVIRSQYGQVNALVADNVACK